MHPRNLHQDRYPLETLLKGTPDLQAYLKKNPRQELTIDFTQSAAVKVLNQALLKEYYDVEYWDLPENFLCPPVPGRADHVHYVADLFSNKTNLRGLDIGTGANCIYPLIGKAAYGWKFVASDINSHALENAQKIVTQNQLQDWIELRLQPKPKHIFHGIIQKNETFDFTLCNPPFHASAQAAMDANQRKRQNLGHTRKELNFGGVSQELWCEGGERAFISQMIRESQEFSTNCRWFTTLVSKEENLPGLKAVLKQTGTKEIKLLEMQQGQKKSRLLAWTFI